MRQRMIAGLAGRAVASTARKKLTGGGTCIGSNEDRRDGSL